MFRNRRDVLASVLPVEIAERDVSLPDGRAISFNTVEKPTGGKRRNVSAEPSDFSRDPAAADGHKRRRRLPFREPLHVVRETELTPLAP